MSKKFDLKAGTAIFKGQSYHDALNMLSAGILKFDDLARNVDEDHWVDLLKFEDFGEFVTKRLMIASNGYSSDSLFSHWYLKDGENNFGPFSMLQLLEFFKQRRLELGHMVRHPTIEDWIKFGEAGPFAPRSLEKILSCPEIHKVITRRSQPRVQYSNEVFISATGELYRGVSWSLSARGVGLVTDKSTVMQAGDRVNLIINSNNEHGSVQVKGRVANIRKELNYERVAIEFDHEIEVLNQYIHRRIPRP